MIISVKGVEVIDGTTLSRLINTPKVFLDLGPLGGGCCS